MGDSMWTFFGHWDQDSIMVEYVLPGVVQDDRVDGGFWPQGLWAASGPGASIELAEAAVVAEYVREAHNG